MSNPVIHTSPDEKIVCYLSTRRLYDMLPAAYNSLLAYNPDVSVYILIEDDNLPYPTPGNITTINITGQDFFQPSGPNYRTKYTYMILFKAAMHTGFSSSTWTQS